MKILKYIPIIVVALIISSCNLERFPLTSLSEDNFWDDDNNVSLALTAMYRGDITVNTVEYSASDFWSTHGMLYMEHLTDNAFDRRGENDDYFQISSGYLTSSNSEIERYWTHAYSRIGRCNRFIEGIQNSETLAEKDRMLAEARFLRATQYHYLASYFKDVPLVTSVLSGEESNNVTKETQANILAWCVNEFTEAAKDLPRFQDITSSETGRACKQAALAFLGRTCMLQKDWAAGAAAYKEIIDYGDNDIHSSYSELFWPGTGVGNKENIFYIQYIETYFGFALPQDTFPAKDGGWSASNPSAGLFESYEFLDGSDFSYDDPRFEYPDLGKNRDPRLDYTIYYNGSTFMGTEYRMSPDYNPGLQECLDYSSEASKTGYMWRKYFDENPVSNLNSCNAVTPIIRYAEVLLSYLECLIESGQSIDQSILDATINKVRGRADVNMPAITNTDTSYLREKVRNERRIELCFEGIRFWDIMRWGIAGDVLDGYIWGAPYPDSETYAESTKLVDPTGNYRWYVGERHFRDPQDYTWPIPLSEQNINPNLRD